MLFSVVHLWPYNVALCFICVFGLCFALVCIAFHCLFVLLTIVCVLCFALLCLLYCGCGFVVVRARVLLCCCVLCLIHRITASIAN